MHKVNRAQHLLPLQNRWIDFFSVMEGGEGGERLSGDALRTLWIDQLGSFMQDAIELEPSDLPPLTDLERAFRRVKPRKAVGEDGIPPELCHQSMPNPSCSPCLQPTHQALRAWPRGIVAPGWCVSGSLEEERLSASLPIVQIATHQLACGQDSASLCA